MKHLLARRCGGRSSPLYSKVSFMSLALITSSKSVYYTDLRTAVSFSISVISLRKSQHLQTKQLKRSLTLYNGTDSPVEETNSLGDFIWTLEVALCRIRWLVQQGQYCVFWLATALQGLINQATVFHSPSNWETLTGDAGSWPWDVLCAKVVCHRAAPPSFSLVVLRRWVCAVSS